MAVVRNVVDGWRRLAVTVLALLALAFVPFHPALCAPGPAVAPGHHGPALDMHQHASGPDHHMPRGATAAGHAPCSMSACGLATLPTPASPGAPLAFLVTPVFPTETGRPQLAAAPEQPPPRA